MIVSMDRRQLLTIGAVTGVTAIVYANSMSKDLAGPSSSDVVEPEANIFFFDPTSPTARKMAVTRERQKLVAMQGDPVRLWRRTIVGQVTSIAGATSWGNYVVLRSLSEEIGKRIDYEKVIAKEGGAIVVLWKLA